MVFLLMPFMPFFYCLDGLRVASIFDQGNDDQCVVLILMPILLGKPVEYSYYLDWESTRCPKQFLILPKAGLY